MTATEVFWTATVQQRASIDRPSNDPLFPATSIQPL